jgi:predicted RNA-binding protein YlxR (DUF448 family)
LARLVCFEGALVWDEAWRAPGRGAYVHLDLACLSKMSQVARWERALRLKAGSLAVDQVRELAEQLLSEASFSLATRDTSERRRGDG